MHKANASVRARQWLATLFMGLLGLGGAAWAQDDPPGRVGRLAEIQGNIYAYDHESGQWTDAERNRPLTRGDRLSTAEKGRAEVRIGSTVLRLGASSELEFQRLDDERISVMLHSGSLALRVRSREIADEIDVLTAEARLQPLRSGHYRVDRIDDNTLAGSWRGELRVEGREGLVIAAGERVELWREGPGRVLRQSASTMPADEFGDWVARDERRDERSASSQYVSPEMTGAEDLDRYGRWDRHPEHGAVWFPLELRVGWAPYRYGRWAWVRPWGWTWVDEAPWGFAPFHYGRWVHWRGRWGWAPGQIVHRPVYAPALVAWVGGSNWGVSVQVGGPTIGWVPLAPGEVFVPYYRHTPVYVDRVNGHRHGPPDRGHAAPRPPQHRAPPSGPIMYDNQGVPGGVTVVPRDALVHRRPISRVVADGHEPRRQPPAVPLPTVAPPAGPTGSELPVPAGRPVGPARPGHARETGPQLQASPGAAPEAHRPERGAAPAPPPNSRPEPPQTVDAQADRRGRPGRPERMERTERTERTEPIEPRAAPDWARGAQQGQLPPRAAQPLAPSVPSVPQAAAPAFSLPPPPSPAAAPPPAVAAVPAPAPVQAQPRQRPNEGERQRGREKPRDRDPGADPPEDQRNRSGEVRTHSR